jgi:hypothetical protein
MAMRWFIVRESARVDKLQEIEQVSELLSSAVIATPSGERSRQG